MYKNLIVGYSSVAYFGDVSTKEITIMYEAHVLNLYWQTDFGAFWSSLVNALWYLSSNQLEGAIESSRELCTLSVAEVLSMLLQWKV